MRALVIEPAEARIREVELPENDTPHEQLRAVRGHVGGHIELAQRLPNGDVALVNEEGQLNSPHFFVWLNGAPEPYAGNVVVVGGPDADGDLTPAKSTVAELQAVTQFSIGTAF